MSSGSNSKATGCVTIVIILLILAFFGWLITPNIENDEKVISAIQGGWTVQEKSGGYFYNIKIEIDGNNFKAWRTMELTDKSIDDWGQPVCEGTFNLGPVQTYNNAADEFRHISWNNCMDIHSAYYSNTGMYWGEWGPMSRTSRGFWYGFKWLLYIVGAGFLVFVLWRWRKKKANEQNAQTAEQDSTNTKESIKNLSENQIKTLIKKAKLVKCESCGYYPVEYGYICTKCGTTQSKENKPIIATTETAIQQKENIPVESTKKKSSFFKIFIIAGIVIIAVAAFFIWKKFEDEKQQSINLEKQRVEQIVEQVNQAIAQQNYDLALSTLNDINWQFNPDGNKQYVEQYNNQRENLRKIIAPLRSQDSLKKVEIALQLSIEQSKQDSIQKADTLITAELTLISGACGEDGCTFTFKNGEGADVYTSQLPENSVEFSNTAEGGTDVKKKYLNKKYSVKYKIKNVHHEASNSDNIEMVIEEMSIVK